MIVAEARQGPEAAADRGVLLVELEAEVVAVDDGQAEAAASAWRRFAKSRHPAGLNLGDAFSYALARIRSEPLLFKGRDFAATDIMQASGRTPMQSGRVILTEAPGAAEGFE